MANTVTIPATKRKGRSQDDSADEIKPPLLPSRSLNNRSPATKKQQQQEKENCERLSPVSVIQQIEFNNNNDNNGQTIHIQNSNCSQHLHTEISNLTFEEEFLTFEEDDDTTSTNNNYMALHTGKENNGHTDEDHPVPVVSSIVNKSSTIMSEATNHENTNKTSLGKKRTVDKNKKGRDDKIDGEDKSTVSKNLETVEKEVHGNIKKKNKKINNESSIVEDSAAGDGSSSSLHKTENSTASMEKNKGSCESTKKKKAKSDSKSKDDGKGGDDKVKGSVINMSEKQQQKDDKDATFNNEVNAVDEKNKIKNRVSSEEKKKQKKKKKSNKKAGKEQQEKEEKTNSDNKLGKKKHLFHIRRDANEKTMEDGESDNNQDEEGINSDREPSLVLFDIPYDLSKSKKVNIEEDDLMSSVSNSDKSILSLKSIFKRRKGRKKKNNYSTDDDDIDSTSSSITGSVMSAMDYSIASTKSAISLLSGIFRKQRNNINNFNNNSALITGVDDSNNSEFESLSDIDIDEYRRDETNKTECFKNSKGRNKIAKSKEKKKKEKKTKKKKKNGSSSKNNNVPKPSKNKLDKTSGNQLAEQDKIENTLNNDDDKSTSSLSLLDSSTVVVQYNTNRTLFEQEKKKKRSKKKKGGDKEENEKKQEETHIIKKNETNKNEKNHRNKKNVTNTTAVTTSTTVHDDGNNNSGTSKCKSSSCSCSSIACCQQSQVQHKLKVVTRKSSTSTSGKERTKNDNSHQNPGAIYMPGISSDSVPVTTATDVASPSSSSAVSAASDNITDYHKECFTTTQETQNEEQAVDISSTLLPGNARIGAISTAAVAVDTTGVQVKEESRHGRNRVSNNNNTIYFQDDENDVEEVLPSHRLVVAAEVSSYCTEESSINEAQLEARIRQRIFNEAMEAHVVFIEDNNGQIANDNSNYDTELGHRRDNNDDDNGDKEEEEDILKKEKEYGTISITDYKNLPKPKGVREKLFGNAPLNRRCRSKNRSETIEIAATPECIRKRNVLEWEIKKNWTTNNTWIASIQTNQQYDTYYHANNKDRNADINTVVVGRTICHFSCKTKEEAIEIAIAYATPKMLPFDENPLCYICKDMFAILRRPSHCRNCGICVCSSCTKSWPSCMLPETFNTKKETNVKVCLACDWLAMSFRDALIEGNYQKAIDLYSSSNVNLRTPYFSNSNNNNEHMYPIHAAVIGGNLDLIKWLTETHYCPLRDTTAVNSNKKSRMVLDGHINGRNNVDHILKWLTSSIQIIRGEHNKVRGGNGESVIIKKHLSDTTPQSTCISTPTTATNRGYPILTSKGSSALTIALQNKNIEIVCYLVGYMGMKFEEEKDFINPKALSDFSTALIHRYNVLAMKDETCCCLVI